MMDLSDILARHREWLAGLAKGERANLHGADLRRANLYEADLRGADLYAANLYEADLRGANLRGANLCGADLYETDLRGADLRGVTLCGADLPSPIMLLLAQWGELSPALCSSCMRFDAASHRDPSAFTSWARGGPCPYVGENYERAINFKENRHHWDPTTPLLRPWELMVNLIRSCCRDSDFHT